MITIIMDPQLQDNTYKMTEEDVKRLIGFRASNEVLFTGKRNSAKIAWSTILRGLGLEGKLTADQIAKKWDNLRTKYKDLKQPYQGQEHIGAVAESWPWFHIMDEAMQGHLYSSDLVLSPDILDCTVHLPSAQANPNQDNTDILEFLIKTEMEDTVAAVTEAETERMIKLRAANEALFTGRRHSAKPAWRAILYELGLQGKLTTDQLAKKWDNLKRRYKELKCPRGMETNPSSWPWFYRMNDAIEGRFVSSAPILTPVVEDEDEDYESLSPTPKKVRRSRGSMTAFLMESEMDLLVDNEERNGSSALVDLPRVTEFTYKLTEEDTRRLIELRAANEPLFTGRRNTAKPAWRGIVKELGLMGKITPDQVAKKWDNLKTKFKDLRFPPRGMEAQTIPASWPWFQLMSDALEGQLAGKAPKVTPIWTNDENCVFSSPPHPDGDGLMVEKGGVPGVESMVGRDITGADTSTTLIDASGEECSTPSEFSYKLTDQDTRRMIKLRAANELLFTGRRNAAKAAWKAILKELSLLGKVSTYQMARKWDNLKRKYKDLKYPPAGVDRAADSASSWPWFHLMNEAMEGHLASSAPLLVPVSQDDDQHLDPAPRHRRRPTPPSPPCSDFDEEVFGGEQRTAPCNRPLDQEWAVLEREREVVERDRGAVERERAAMQAERLWLDRERAALERDRALMDQDREALGREREVLDQRTLMLSSVGHLSSLV